LTRAARANTSSDRMAGDFGTPVGLALQRRFMRHVVGVYCDFREHGQRSQVVYTAFVFSVDDHWMLITAGHCITDIEQVRARGGDLHRCSLIDSMGEGAAHLHPLPFAYDAAHPMNIGRLERIDYGVLIPPENTCQLLARNNIEPFDESAWEAEPARVLDYFLLGFPEDLNRLQGERVNFRASMFRVAKYDERPEDFPEEDPAIYWYGRVFENPLGSVRGCSGGPIVALSHPNDQGVSTYHLIALQSTAMGRDIKGMLMQPLGQLVRACQAGTFNNQDDEEPQEPAPRD
jgi:hypothetical protein